MKKSPKKVEKPSAKNLIRPINKIVKKIKEQLTKRKKTKTSVSKKIVRRRVFKSAVKSALSKVASTAQSYKPSFKPAFSTHAYPSSFELSDVYGETKLVLLVRDPWWLFTYWEVTPEREQEVRAEIARRDKQADKTVLRVYDVTGTDEPSRANAYFDIELNFLINNWYIDVGVPDRQWIAELGIRTKDGAFYVLVRSNKVKTPRYGVSDVLDEEWLLPDELYWKILGMCGGLDQSKSSLDVRDFLEKYLRERISSGENVQK